MEKLSLSKDKIRFLLLEGIHSSALDNLHRAGYSNVDVFDYALDPEELYKIIPNYHFIGIRSRTQLDREFFKHTEKLIGVGCFCIGTNQVDLDAAREAGVAVFNAPYSNTRSVAELVMGEIILLLRDIPRKNTLVHQGIWAKSAKNSYEIRGKRLGIIGYGNIGSQLSVLAESLGMRVYFYDVIPKLPLGNATQIHSLGALLEKCDVITLHVPETEQTKNMIGPEELSHMQPGAILINASRGTVVDLDALHSALKNGKILGAALDVYPSEPSSNDEPFINPLQEFNNVILTPHVGGSTQEAQENIGEEVTDKLVKYSDNGSTLGSVNFPEVSLPSYPKKHRLLHVHQNVPGILSQINTVLSQSEVNISSQYLETRDNIGYVVMDIDVEYNEKVLTQLRRIPGTIKARVLF